MEGIEDLLKAVRFIEQIEYPLKRPDFSKEIAIKNIEEYVKDHDNKDKFIQKRKNLPNEKFSGSRMQHNKSEKERRETMRLLLKEVKDMLPASIKNDRSSTAKILVASREYIKNTTDEIHNFSQKLNTMHEERLQLCEQVKQFISQQNIQSITEQNCLQELDKDDRCDLQHENTTLQNIYEIKA